MGDNFILVIARNYFWGITELNWEKMAIAENSYSPPPQKKGKFMFASFRPKNMAFKWNFRPKSMARTLPYANMTSTPPGG